MECVRLILSYVFVLLAADGGAKDRRSGISMRSRRSIKDMTSYQQECNKTVYENVFPCGGDGFVPLPDLDTCVFYGSDSTSRDGALRKCQQKLSNLLYIPDVQTDRAIDAWEEFEGNVWIGLNNENARGEWSWYPFQKVTYTNWDWQPTASDQCIIKSKFVTGHKWRAISCTQKTHYICQRENLNYSHPADVVIWTNAGRHGHAVVGSKIQVHCKITGPVTENVRFELLAGPLATGTITIGTGDQKIQQYPPEYIIPSNMCLKVGSWDLNLKVLYSYLGRYVRCCADLVGTRVKCGLSSRPMVVDVGENKPFLNVSYSFGLASAVCTAVVANGGGVAWIMAGERERRVWTWTLKEKDASPVDPNNMPSVTVRLVSRNIDDERGIVLVSEMEIVQRRELEGLNLACYNDPYIQVYSVAQLLRQRGPSRSNVHVLPLSVPKRPKLDHTETRSAGEGLISVIRCKAWVGKGGAMTWRFLRGNLTGRWTVDDHSQYELDPRRAPAAGAILNGSVSSSYNYQKGTIIVSQMTVNLTESEASKMLQVVACISYNDSDPFYESRYGGSLESSVTYDFRDARSKGGYFTRLLVFGMVGIILFASCLAVVVYPYILARKAQPHFERRKTRQSSMRNTVMASTTSDDESSDTYTTTMTWTTVESSL